MKPSQRSHTLSKKLLLSPVVVAVVEAAEADKAEAKEMAEIVDSNEVSPAEADKTVEAVKAEDKEIRVTLVTRVSVMQMGPLLKFV